MKYRKILLILAIATLSLTACKKEENPAPAEATAIEETKEETEPIVENEPIAESETETITSDDIAEIEVETTETELPADVDLEKEYEEPITEEPDYESMTQDERIEAATKDLVDDIINRYIQEQAQQNHIPVDDDDWGRVDDGTLANPKEYGKTSNPDLAGGNFN